MTERGEEERERELVGEIIECERERAERRDGFSKMLLK